MSSRTAIAGPEAPHTVPQRFFITLAAQISKSTFSFLTGMVVARGLGPTEYGNLAFLLGSFQALRILIDMSTGLACFTLASQRARSKSFYMYYSAWLLGVEIALPLLCILLLFPDKAVSLLWLNQDRERVWLALLASQLQYLIWPQMVQLGEVVRRTHTAQILTISISAGQFAVVFGLYMAGLLTLPIFLITTGIAFLLGIIASFVFLPKPWSGDAPREHFGEVFGEFFAFCRPLIFSYSLQALQGWVEVWLLQHFAGAKEQAYYALGMQISLIGLLATTALQNIFWREIAAVEATGDNTRVRAMYLSTSRILLFTAAAPVAFLLPWTAEVVQIALGEQYRDAVPAVATMLIYPVTQCLTTLVFVLYYSMRETKVLALIAGGSAIANIAGSYFVLAPTGGALPGLELGGAGMGARIVIVAIASLLILEGWIHARRGWKHDWAHRLRMIGVLLLLSLLARGVGVAVGMVAPSLAALAAGAAVFGIATAAVFYRFSDWAGISMETRDHYLAQARAFLSRG